LTSVERKCNIFRKLGDVWENTYSLSVRFPVDLIDAIDEDMVRVTMKPEFDRLVASIWGSVQVIQND
jgi:hypothetical protein